MFQKVTKESDPKSVRAELRYSVQHELKGASLVRASLVTGLQNQIRVQFSAIGHPIIGDRKYNPTEKLERRITRVALHAAHLAFLHPRSGDNVCVDCEPPPDFQALLEALGLPGEWLPR
jgi:23S rRNA pseudouridine1911/1915/1917 synthase